MVGNRLKPVLTLVLSTSIVMAMIAPVAGATESRTIGTQRAGAQVSSSRVLLRLSASQVPINHRAIVTALVRPQIAGRIVVLQRRGPRRWRNLASKITTTAGKAVFHLTMHVAASVRLRAEVLANTDFIEAKSAPSTVEFLAPPPVYAGLNLTEGDHGAAVTALQTRLSDLGYWLGTPDGYFGDSTQQAVWAIQKAAGINPSGIVYSNTVAALVAGTLPTPKPTKGYVIEINLKNDLMMFVTDGKIDHVINTSTGGGYNYIDMKIPYVATTPKGYFHIFSAEDKLVVDSLGSLWRPRFFVGGYAIHGDTYVPPTPVSHGCARVSYEAINWIWANHLAPYGTPVWVFG